MRFQRIIEQVNFRPWLITPSAHASIKSLVESKLKENSAINLSDFTNQRKAMEVTKDGIAKINVLGPIGQGLSQMEKNCGSTGTEEVLSELQSAVQNGMVKGIFLDIDSPGGTISGIPELADYITYINQKQKTVMSFTEGMMCSAAYWIAAGSEKIYASKSADVGSIGVYMPWIDSTAAYEMEGMKVELIRNSGADLKGTGYPGTPLSESQRADLQQHVDEVAQMFLNHIRENRSQDIPNDAFRGQSFLAQSAYAFGLIDAISSREDAMNDLILRTS